MIEKDMYVAKGSRLAVNRRSIRVSSQNENKHIGISMEYSLWNHAVETVNWITSHAFKARLIKQDQ